MARILSSGFCLARMNSSRRCDRREVTEDPGAAILQTHSWWVRGQIGGRWGAFFCPDYDFCCCFKQTFQSFRIALFRKECFLCFNESHGWLRRNEASTKCTYGVNFKQSLTISEFLCDFEILMDEGHPVCFCCTRDRNNRDYTISYLQKRYRQLFLFTQFFDSRE